MNKPTFEDGPDVPLMVEGIMDESMLSKFVEELRQFAKLESVREKSGPITYSNDQTLNLQEGIQRLRTQQTRSIQIRYSFSEADWTDTILTLPDGTYRTVRSKHEPQSWSIGGNE